MEPNIQSLSAEIEAEAQELNQYLEWIAFLVHALESGLIPKEIDPSTQHIESKVYEAEIEQTVNQESTTHAIHPANALSIMKANAYVMIYNFYERSVRKLFIDFFTVLNQSGQPLYRIHDKYHQIYIDYFKMLELSNDNDKIRNSLFKPKSAQELTDVNSEANFPHIIVQIPTIEDEAQSLISEQLKGKLFPKKKIKSNDKHSISFFGHRFDDESIECLQYIYQKRSKLTHGEFSFLAEGRSLDYHDLVEKWNKIKHIVHQLVLSYDNEIIEEAYLKDNK